MNIEISKRDIKIVTVVLVLFTAWAAYGRYDAQIMRDELSELAQWHIDDWFDGGEKPIPREDYDYLVIVDSDKAFKLFGRGWGIIHFYMRDKGDDAMDTFKGLEYYYTRENGEWLLLDSAGCGAKEHHLRAFDQMLAMGHDVEDRVFDQALGIDFDWRKYMTDHEGHDHGPIPPRPGEAHDHSGHDHSSHDHSGHDHSSHDHSSHDHENHNQEEEIQVAS